VRAAAELGFRVVGGGRPPPAIEEVRGWGATVQPAVDGGDGAAGVPPRPRVAGGTGGGGLLGGGGGGCQVTAGGKWSLGER
jgi:hypothetical protein